MNYTFRCFFYDRLGTNLAPDCTIYWSYNNLWRICCTNSLVLHVHCGWYSHNANLKSSYTADEEEEEDESPARTDHARSMDRKESPRESRRLIKPSLLIISTRLILYSSVNTITSDYNNLFPIVKRNIVFIWILNWRIRPKKFLTLVVDGTKVYLTHCQCCQSLSNFCAWK